MMVITLPDRFAKLHECNMVTNDNLLDHIEAAPDRKAMLEFVRSHTIKFMFIRDEYMPI